VVNGIEQHMPQGFAARGKHPLETAKSWWKAKAVSPWRVLKSLLGRAWSPLEFIFKSYLCLSP
jgi:hypothetical protein